MFRDKQGMVCPYINWGTWVVLLLPMSLVRMLTWFLWYRLMKAWRLATAGSERVDPRILKRLPDPGRGGEVHGGECPIGEGSVAIGDHFGDVPIGRDRTMGV